MDTDQKHGFKGRYFWRCAVGAILDNESEDLVDAVDDDYMEVAMPWQVAEGCTKLLA